MKGQLSLFNEEYIKDSDCTKETPVIYGKPDDPIYGTGTRITPRVKGREDSEHMKNILLPELLPLEEYDLIAILLSGGKDSIACYYKLLELGACAFQDKFVIMDGFFTHFHFPLSFQFHSVFRIPPPCGIGWPVLR